MSTDRRGGSFKSKSDTNTTQRTNGEKDMSNRESLASCDQNRPCQADVRDNNSAIRRPPGGAAVEPDLTRQRQCITSVKCTPRKCRWSAAAQNLDI